MNNLNEIEEKLNAVYNSRHITFAILISYFFKFYSILLYSKALLHFKFMNSIKKYVKFSKKWPPYLIRHFECFIFDLGIVISDLKYSLILIFVQPERKMSNLVKNARHIESTILNFSILTAES